ncbi:hypothetical protein CXB45_01310 [Corynebacterium mastitidis]|uniref:Uncharacterized protein n=1 Tax=Corynebacterium mastitidis TaxID=161890 RepID=A0A2N0X9Y9_9CORY|nr:hypothetical protein CXB45_01310 [Corynebacterium mastitidis]
MGVDSIRQAQQAIEAAQQQLHRAVHAARARGSSWAEIGAALGVSRQAAFKRFGAPIDPRTGKPMRTRPVTTLIDLTERLFAHIDAQRWDEAAALLHPDTRKELTPEVFLQAWTSTIGDYGDFDGCRDTLVTTASRTNAREPLHGSVVGTAVGVTTLHFEAGECLGRVSFTPDDLIDGVYLLPTDAKESHF